MNDRVKPVPVVEIVLTILAIIVILAVLENYGVLHLSNLFTNKYK